MTWNIHHGADVHDRLDLEAVAAVIGASDADVVALQEVDRRWGDRSGGVDQAAWLARRLGMHAAHAPVVRSWRWQRPWRLGAYGVALLSRGPLRGVERGRFTKVSGRERRGYLLAEVDGPAGPLQVCCTHLDAQAGPVGVQQREAQVRELLTRLGPGVVAVAGDFNADDDEPVTDVLAGRLSDAFALSGTGPGATLASGARIDRVWVRGLTVRDARVIQSDASDHRPLLVTLEA